MDCRRPRSFSGVRRRCDSCLISCTLRLESALKLYRIGACFCYLSEPLSDDIQSLACRSVSSNFVTTLTASAFAPRWQTSLHASMPLVSLCWLTQVLFLNLGRPSCVSCMSVLLQATRYYKAPCLTVGRSGSRPSRRHTLRRWRTRGVDLLL